MNDIAQRVVHRLKEKDVIFTSVESCTGGLLSHLITNVGGAAQVFWVRIPPLSLPVLADIRQAFATSTSSRL